MQQLHLRRICFIIVLCLIFSTFCSSCGQSEENASSLDSVRISKASSKLPATHGEAFEKFRNSAQGDAEEILQSLAQQTVAFTAENYHYFFTKSEETDNRLLAPVGLYTILSWLSEGAEGEVKTNLLKGLQTPNGEQLQAQMKGLSHLSYSGDTGAWINSNSLWMDKKISDSMNADFLRVSQEIYQSDLFGVDFSKPETGKYMSQYVDQTTHGLIQSVPDPKADTALSLLNVFYFASGWTSPFDEGLTKEATFTDAAGGKSDVPFMHKQFVQDVLRTPHFDAVDLYLENGRMRLVLPQEGVALSELNQPEFLHRILNDMPKEPYDLDLRLPRFEMEHEGSLLEGLARSGVGGIFDSKHPATFKMITGTETELSDILQGCCLKVAEKQVVAAGYTRADLKASAAMPVAAPPLTLDLNRPFMVILYSDEDLPLLIGEVRKLG